MTDICFGEDNKATDVINLLTELANEKCYVFRGYSKTEELYPSILRGKASLVKYEKEMLKEFERNASHYYQVNSPIDFMACAQHFGLPTRLLDFTRNPFISLAFALYKPKEESHNNDDEKSFFYIRYADVNKNIVVTTIPMEQLLYFRSINTFSFADGANATIKRAENIMNGIFEHEELEEFGYDDLSKVSVNKCNTEKIKQLIDRKSILFIEPNFSNERIIMQQGLFMFPYTINREEHSSIIANNTKEIKIHQSLRKELIEYLDILGINTYRLMPDISSVCAAIKNNAIEGRVSEDQ